MADNRLIAMKRNTLKISWKIYF